jgi:ribosomal protein S12 methylthiotransferase
LIDAKRYYLKQGDFTTVEITEATDFDLYGIPANKPTPVD